MATPTSQDKTVEAKLRQVEAGLKAAQKAFWNLPDRELYASKYATRERDLNEMGDNIASALEYIQKTLQIR